MPLVDVTVETKLSTSVRARQVSSMFDAPVTEKCTLRWHLDVPIETDDWQVGLIVGPSGSGKSSVTRHLFGDLEPIEWEAASVIDDFGREYSVEQIAEVCQAVGFSTIPAWLRPFAVLSNGEKFRVELARRLLSSKGLLAVDEFSSLVDRQVAQIGSYAVQKFIRRDPKRSFVAITCHYDVESWLQPDWVLDMATRQFQRRLLQRRPAIECTIGRLPRAAWAMFAPYHYLTASIHNAAQCFGLWANGRLAVFSSTIHAMGQDGEPSTVQRLHRTVTLPDWQGLGLAMVLTDALGGAYAARGKRLRSYPAHPSYSRARDRSTLWKMIKAPGKHHDVHTTRVRGTKIGGRPCAVFEYVGPPAVTDRLLGAA